MADYYVHESSYIDEGCQIGNGTKIWHFSHIMSDCKIGEDCNIGQNVVISPKVVLGKNVKIQNNVSLYEGVICEDDVFLGPSCVFTNVVNPRSFISRKTEYRKTTLHKGASVGANCTIVCGHDIGSYAFIGAGSVVTKDVPDYACVVGNPAKLLCYVCECGEDFYLGFSPERVDPGNTTYHTKNTPKVVGAIGKDATEVIAAMYRAVLDGDIHEVSSPAVAEMEKILENTYLNINIGLVNELCMLCEKMGISAWEVIDAAKTKPFGYQAFYPGPGLGGHCIPLDPYYLTWKAREYGFHTSMIENSMIINDKMPEYCVERCYKVLNKQKKAMAGSKLLVLGVAYKNDIDDYRESPALKLIDLLKKENAEVDFFDPYIPEYRYFGKTYKGIEKIDPMILGEYDLIVIATAHKSYDLEMIQKSSKAIFDSRNAMKDIADKSNIELL